MAYLVAKPEQEAQLVGDDDDLQPSLDDVTGADGVELIEGEA